MPSSSEAQKLGADSDHGLTRPFVSRRSYISKRLERPRIFVDLVIEMQSLLSYYNVRPHRQRNSIAESQPFRLRNHALHRNYGAMSLYHTRGILDGERTSG